MINNEIYLNIELFNATFNIYHCFTNEDNGIIMRIFKTVEIIEVIERIYCTKIYIFQ